MLTPLLKKPTDRRALLVHPRLVQASCRDAAMMAIRENPQDAREASVLDRTPPASAAYGSRPAYGFDAFWERGPCSRRPFFSCRGCPNRCHAVYPLAHTLDIVVRIAFTELRRVGLQEILCCCLCKCDGCPARGMSGCRGAYNTRSVGKVCSKLYAAVQVRWLLTTSAVVVDGMFRVIFRALPPSGSSLLFFTFAAKYSRRLRCNPLTARPH